MKRYENLAMNTLKDFTNVQDAFYAVGLLDLMNKNSGLNKVFY